MNLLFSTFTALSILNFYNPFYVFYDAFFVPLFPANPGTIKIGIYLIIQPNSWFRISSLETISRQCSVVTGMGNCVNLTSPDQQCKNWSWQWAQRRVKHNIITLPQDDGTHQNWVCSLCQEMPLKRSVTVM